MTPELVSFIVLSIASIATAIGVVAFKNAIHSALSLILTLLFLAMFYLLLNAMFIAIVQVLIYAGAIMVLFLFVVTMLAPGQDEEVGGRDHIPWQRWIGGFLGLVLAGSLSYLLLTGASLTGAKATGTESLSRQLALPGSGSVEAFGNALFHGYLFPFEVTSLLIVIAILGALIFARRA